MPGLPLGGFSWSSGWERMRGAEPNRRRGQDTAPSLTGDPRTDGALLALARLLSDIASRGSVAETATVGFLPEHRAPAAGDSVSEPTAEIDQ